VKDLLLERGELIPRGERFEKIGFPSGEDVKAGLLQILFLEMLLKVFASRVRCWYPCSRAPSWKRRSVLSEQKRNFCFAFGTWARNS